MPQRKTALKSLKVSKKRRVRNLFVRKKVKDAIKNLLKAVKDQNAEKAKQQLTIVYKELDKAAAKGVIHKNKAARKKSRLTGKLTPAKSPQK